MKHGGLEVTVDEKVFETAILLCLAFRDITEDDVPGSDSGTVGSAVFIFSPRLKIIL